MPQVLRVHLRGPRPSHPYLHVKAGRAVALGWIAAADPALSRELHDLNAPKPYGLSPLWSDPETPDECWLDLSVAADWIAAPLLEGLRRSGPEVRLGPARYHVDAVEPLFGAEWHELCAPAPAGLRELRLELRTPTAHHATASRRKYVVLPSPELYFGSWLDRWNRAAPWKLERRVLDRVADSVGIVHCAGATQRVQLEPERWLTGFVGEVRFGFLGPEVGPEERSVLAALARFAPFCGTGVETMRGCGQTRFLTPGELPPGAPARGSRAQRGADR